METHQGQQGLINPHSQAGLREVSLQAEISSSLQASAFLSVFVAVLFVQSVVEHVLSVLESKRTAFHNHSAQLPLPVNSRNHSEFWGLLHLPWSSDIFT